MSFGIHHWTFTGEVLGSEVKAALMKLVFNQSLQLSKKGSRESPLLADSGFDSLAWTEGKIVNLISTDASRVDECLRYGHLIWTGPVMVIFCLTLLLLNLGYSVLPGLALLILATEALKHVVGFTIKKRLLLNEALDRRVEASKETLQNIQLIKYYAWEKIFLKRILNIRTEELKHLRTYEIVSNGTFAISISIPLFCMVLTFAVFSLTGHELQPARVFSSLALFNCLRMPLATVPMLIGQIPNAVLSLDRIQKFLEVQNSEDIALDRSMSEAVVFDQATFYWPNNVEVHLARDLSAKGLSTERSPLLDDADQAIPTSSSIAESLSLNNINLRLGKSEFVAVTGRVASGKSSLLSALNEEMELRSGRVAACGSIAYSSQSPWIMSGTIKQNIIFGKKFKREKYDKVIEACALLKDLQAMPEGSETAVGERGVTLSGGQKQRIGLARAIYSDCPIVLLDDPFSAVDAKVAKHVFTEVFGGPFLRNRCTILVTHHLDLLPKADRIIWMRNGEIQACDTFGALRQAYPGFENLVRDLKSESNDVRKESPKCEEPPQDERSRNKQTSSLVEDEHQEVGSVSARIYKAYAVAAGGFCWQIVMLIVLCVAQATSLLTGLVLAWWTSDRFGLSRGSYICVYAVCGIAQYTLVFAFYTLYTINGLKASKRLLQNALTRILQTSMSYFNTTPIGRLLSLFTRDVDLIDGTTGSAIIVFLNSLAVVVSTIIFMSALLPWVIPLILFLLLGCFYSGKYYRRTARELKRHETVLRSICMAQVAEAITGSNTIRGCRAGEQFSHRLNNAINEMSACTHLVAATRQWLGFRLDFVGNVLVLAIAVIVVLQRERIDPSLSGLVMTYALAVVNQLAYLVSNAGQLEDSMVPVERMEHYSTAIPQEIDVKQEMDAIALSWPQGGKVDIYGLTIQYNPRHLPALSNLTMKIPSGGITNLVGRTGSGKSTFLASLFRMAPVPVSGSIHVDNVDISTISLQRLRGAISIVPQDPACWHGTVKDNVDPNHVLSDARIEKMLRKCSLSNSLSNSNHGLNLGSQVESGGSNLSFGQRQLLALARALLRNTGLLVLDEATSGLDTQTNDTILDVVKREVEERALTVLFVAHRMSSVKRLGGRVVVLEKGEMVEEGEIEQLWRKDVQGSDTAWFKELCQAAGVSFDQKY
ncbi:MAG: hypothetical protein Q9160_007917 [Pyrenula sp. 1 TL-2023]